eukprot:13916350-Alexandrium_andersonii.AAC.1
MLPGVCASALASASSSLAFEIELELVCLLACLSACLPARLLAYLLACLLACLSVCPSVGMSVCSACLFACLPICLPFRVPVYLFPEGRASDGGFRLPRVLPKEVSEGGGLPNGVSEERFHQEVFEEPVAPAQSHDPSHVSRDAKRRRGCRADPGQNSEIRQLYFALRNLSRPIRWPLPTPTAEDCADCGLEDCGSELASSRFCSF